MWLKQSRLWSRKRLINTFRRDLAVLANLKDRIMRFMAQLISLKEKKSKYVNMNKENTA